MFFNNLKLYSYNYITLKYLIFIGNDKLILVIKINLIIEHQLKITYFIKNITYIIKLFLYIYLLN